MRERVRATLPAQPREWGSSGRGPGQSEPRNQGTPSSLQQFPAGAPRPRWSPVWSPPCGARAAISGRRCRPAMIASVGLVLLLAALLPALSIAQPYVNKTRNLCAMLGEWNITPGVTARLRPPFPRELGGRPSGLCTVLIVLTSAFFFLTWTLGTSTSGCG